MKKLGNGPSRKALGAPLRSRKEAHSTDPLHWSRIVRDIRRKQNWTQVNLAKAIGTSQVVISRWERGETTPSPAMRKKILLLGKNSVPKELAQLVEIVTHSPYPMILTDQKNMVLAASTCSGFRKGLDLLAQTPADEINHLQRFADWLAQEGFWKGRKLVFTYNVVVKGDRRKAIVNAIKANDAYYALVQRAV